MSKIITETLSAIKNAETMSKSTVVKRPISKLLLNLLAIAKREGYIKEIESNADSKGGIVTIHLNHKINNIGVISPNFPVKYFDLEKYEKRFLPAAGFGVLILTTSKGLVTNKEAKEKKMGGKLLAYIY